MNEKRARDGATGTCADVQFKSMCADDTSEAKVCWESSACAFVLISAQQMCNSMGAQSKKKGPSKPVIIFQYTSLSLSP